MTIQKKMLVLVDGSERAIHTVNYVKDFMPVDENTRIVLFHVFSGMPEEYRELETGTNLRNRRTSIEKSGNGGEKKNPGVSGAGEKDFDLRRIFGTVN